VRRVAQTLRDGITEDPELEADLRPSPVVVPLPLEEEADRDGLLDFESRTAAASDIAAAAAFDTGIAMAPSDHTQQFEVPEGLGRATTATSPATPPEPGPMRRLPRPKSDLTGSSSSPRRRSRRGPAMLAVTLLLVLAVGLGAWWFGFARYTTTPSLLDMS